MKIVPPAPTAMTLCVVSIIFDGDAINLPALFELRAAGWEVEIEHSAAIPNWDAQCGEPMVFFNARKELPDHSPGKRSGAKVRDAAWKEIEVFSERWDGFFDHMDFFKNPKAKDWKYHPWSFDRA